ncbi:MAG: hypothetical protein HY296_00335, partial [Thaumarchaeota archaeon]|nr:hypothetical protein [Nitrososphaerota archaeon]
MSNDDEAKRKAMEEARKDAEQLTKKQHEGQRREEESRREEVERKSREEAERMRREQEQARKEAEKKLKAEIEGAKLEEQKRRSKEKALAKETKEREEGGEKGRKEDEKVRRAMIAKPERPTLARILGRKDDGQELTFPRTGRPVPPSWKILERYPLYSGFVYATVAEDPTGTNRTYFLDEVPLSDSEAETYTLLMSALQTELAVPRKQVNAKEYFDQQSRKIAAKYSIELPALPWAKILYFTERDVVGFGELDGFMRDPSIEDIS